MELIAGAVETLSAIETEGVFALGFKRNVVLDGGVQGGGVQWGSIAVIVIDKRGMCKMKRFVYAEEDGKRRTKNEGTGFLSSTSWFNGKKTQGIQGNNLVTYKKYLHVFLRRFFDK
jgi:hypothetical protein